MSSASILDADMTTLAGWLRNGFGWWVEELRGMVPAGLNARLGARPAVVARFEQGSFAFSRRGVPVPAGDGPVTLALPAATVLVRDIRLPGLGTADLKRLIAFEAERLLPFAPGAALVAFEAGAQSDGSQPVALAGLPVTVAETALAAAATQGLDVRRLGIVTDTGVRFDFLPALTAAGDVRRRQGQMIWWGIAAAMLLGFVAAMIGRDIQQLNETRELVEAHGQTAATARLLRGRVTAEDARRRTLLERRLHNDPLGVLAAATKALPDSVWTQRLAWDGKQLRLGGFKPASVDVVALLRGSPAFAAVRNTAVEVPAAGEGASQPFEVTAERRR
jgi:Tfp pilus assembly protein PilN